MGDILGGGGGNQSSSTQVLLSPEQQKLIGLAQPAFENILQNTPELFPTSGIAGTTPLQQAGQQGVLQTAAGPATDSVNQLLQLQAFLSGPGLFPSTNPALQDAIAGAVRPLQDTFSQVTLPGIARGAQAGGASGGSRQGVAEGLAASNLQNLVGDVSARVASTGFGQGLDAATKTLAFGPATTQNAFLPSTAIEAVGGQQQAGQQAFLDEQVNRFSLEQLLPFLIAKDVAGIAFGQPTGATSTSDIPGLSTGQAALGGGTLGAAIGGAPGAGIGALLAAVLA